MAIIATSSSVGSDIFAISALLAVSLLVLLLIRYYLPLRTTPGYLLVPVFLALALPCSIVLLVPIDLASSTEGSSGKVWLPERVVTVTWRITYWLTFLLTWFLLPILGEYCDSGYRDTRNRVIYSIKENLRYYLIGLSAGIAGLVYFIWHNGFHVESIKGLVMALAYAYGLILAIGLMGHGLVALPKRLFKNASVSAKLRSLQSQAPSIKDKLDDAKDELEQLENTVRQLRQRKNGIGRDVQEWIDELADTTPVLASRPGVAAAVNATNARIPAVITERYLADLTRKLKRARHKEVRFVREWASLCGQAQDNQAILDAAASQKLEFSTDSSMERGLFDRIKLMTPSMRYQMHAKFMPAVRLGLSLLLAAASVLLLWSEIVSSFAPRISVIGLMVVRHPSSDSANVYFGGQMMAAFWLLYMDACTLYAISDVKIWGNRALVKRQTYAESACFYSLQVAKLTVPLSYNFITMLAPDVYKETSFYKFLGQSINLTPLGYGLSRFFPCLLLIPVLATLFNFYGKVKNVVGFGVLEDDSEDNPSGFGTGGWREGKELIARELNSRAGGGGNVGLSSRGASLDLERRRAASPSIGTSRSPSRPHRSPLLLSNVQDANRQFNSITNQEEETDEGPRHFYQDISERVRNTFDTVERPDWLRNIGSGLKVPKWMGNDQRDDTGASSVSRWFGGRPEDGRVRL